MTDTTQADDLLASMTRDLERFRNIRYPDCGTDWFISRVAWHIDRAASQPARTYASDRTEFVSGTYADRTETYVEPAQEPVATVKQLGGGLSLGYKGMFLDGGERLYPGMKLYAAPLSDQARQDRIMELAQEWVRVAVQDLGDAECKKASKALEREVRKG